MKLVRLLDQKVDSDHFIQTIGQRLFALHIIYDHGKHSGLDHDRVYITWHTNSTGTIQSVNFSLTQAQHVYTNIPDSDNGGEECAICLLCEWPTDDDSRTV